VPHQAVKNRLQRSWGTAPIFTIPSKQSNSSLARNVYIRMLRVILAGCIATAASLVAQTVEGHVINSATGAAIPGVVVSLFPAGPPPGKIAYGAATDAQGRFRIEGVKDGAYTATYSASGFFPVPGFLAASNQQPFRVAAGGDPVRLEAKMQPSGRISGRVLDAAGKPVLNATVWAHWQSGQCQMPMCSGFIKTSKTDEKGEYSITYIDAPGAWLVSATAPATWNPPESSRDSQGDQKLGWAQTFYPGVTDPTATTRVTPGDELWLEFKLAAVPVHRIRGVVFDPNGHPVPKATVTLGKGVGSPVLSQDTNADGVFEFESVADDAWRMFAKATQNGLKLWAVQGAPQRGRDLEDVVLRLTAPFSIQGKVVMEVPDGVPPPGLPELLPGVTMVLNAGGRPAENPVPFFETAQADVKGNFTIRNIYPGPYLIVPDPPPSQYYLDSIRLGDRDALASDVEILSSAEPLTVTYKPNGGTVNGTVDKCASGGVALVPQDTALRRPGLTRFVPCDPNDRYTVPALRPGEYYALAVAGDSGATGLLAVTMAKLDDALLKQASGVTVRAGETSSADLRAIARPAY
jgi:hypothetical protein